MVAQILILCYYFLFVKDVIFSLNQEKQLKLNPNDTFLIGCKFGKKFILQEEEYLLIVDMVRFSLRKWAKECSTFLTLPSFLGVLSLNMVNKFFLVLSMIKFHHSLFALPFALISYFWATKGTIELKSFILIIVAMVSGRSVAMTANRIIDLKFDIKNPRTKNWPLSKKQISLKFAYIFLIVNIFIFETSAFLLNSLCFYLSFVALIFLIGYSYTKRFTSFCHIILGFTDGIAPVGAYLAVKETFSTEAISLCLAITFWVAGFDILYAIQDYDFDKKENLHSFPIKFGIKKSLIISSIFHFLTTIFYILSGIFYGAQILYFIGVVLTIPLLIYEHLIIKPNDLSRINSAFFTLNGYVSIVIFVFALFDIYVGKL